MINQQNTVIQETTLQPVKSLIETYFAVVFSELNGFIPIRSFTEDKNYKKIRNIWLKKDTTLIDKIWHFAQIVARDKKGLFAIPGTTMVYGKANSGYIKQMQTLLVDIDTGNTAAKLDIVSKIIGKPTLVIESGGITVNGSKKLHLYWQLNKPAIGDNLTQLLQLRYTLAVLIDGDLHFKSAHQPIRIAGSIYYKNGANKLVTISAHNDLQYDLAELITKITNHLAQTQQSRHKLPQITTAQSPITEVLIQKVYAGDAGENTRSSTRFSHLQRVIGFWLRRYHDGIITWQQAQEEIFSYNQANVIPAWPQERLVSTINGLWKTHHEKYGPAKQAAQATKADKSTTSTSAGSLLPAMNTISAINLTNCCEQTIPAQEWIVKNWLPKYTVAALYGDGGIGKSLLAQQLMTAIATGKCFLGEKLLPARVYALMCEDDQNELLRRQALINKYYHVSMQELENIRLVSRIGEDNFLIGFKNANTSYLSKFFHNLHKDILDYNPDLVIFDTLADLFGGNENNRIQVHQFIQHVCGRIARSIRCSVLLCAHPSETGIQKGTGSCGSTAWNNTVRTRWYLRAADAKYDKSYRVLSRVKANYASSGGEEYLQWNNGVFEHLGSIDNVKLHTQKEKQRKGNRASINPQRLQVILELINSEAEAGRIYTANQFSEQFKNKQDLGTSRNIRKLLGNLLQQEIITLLENPATRGFNKKSSSYGYLFTQKMTKNI